MKETTTMWIAILILAGVTAVISIRESRLRQDILSLREHSHAVASQALADTPLLEAADKARDAVPHSADDIRRYGYNDGLADALADEWCARTVEDRRAHRSSDPTARALELQWERNAGVKLSNGDAVADEYPGQIEVGQAWRPVDGGEDVTVTEIRRSQSGKKKVFYVGYRWLRRGNELDRIFLDRFRWVSNGE